MPYLVRIGRIDSNASGIGARGYLVQRSGKTVIVTFGKVEVFGDGRTRFYWCHKPRLRRYTKRTVERARAFARWLVQKQLRFSAGGGYDRLPLGVRILKKRIHRDGKRKV